MSESVVQRLLEFWGLPLHCVTHGKLPKGTWPWTHQPHRAACCPLRPSWHPWNPQGQAEREAETAYKAEGGFTPSLPKEKTLVEFKRVTVQARANALFFLAYCWERDSQKSLLFPSAVVVGWSQLCSQRDFRTCLPASNTIIPGFFSLPSFPACT